ncbi:epoxyqueuosine reductase QueG [Methanolinea mesophila]|uniref:4Fe-4S double cluster binding domain-containing protein n=1 Tax=Methanolinea mesophila TaxID=547055 RepID=UPI001AE6E8ED|nr:4Fe-4S double cluster binding domain-containing protein [Methanolinea mesophila]MBP1929963.1 epoxyqueuosine reductase QueG [Methanolinea mesophila]
METAATLKHLAESLGADYFGVADLGSAREFVLAQGGQEIADYPVAISIGIVLLDTLVDLLPTREKDGGGVLYRHHAYDVVNTALDLIALQVANTLQRSGYRALPVGASKRTDDAKICGPVSHKLAARLAGLGWIGRSCLLITPEHGPRVRWVSVLTDAPLAPTGRAIEGRCGECRECVNACPARAFTGIPFDEREPRESRYDARACERYFKEEEIRTGSAVCGMCLFVCPFGRRMKR